MDYDDLQQRYQPKPAQINLGQTQIPAPPVRAIAESLQSTTGNLAAVIAMVESLAGRLRIAPPETRCDGVFTDDMQGRAARLQAQSVTLIAALEEIQQLI